VQVGAAPHRARRPHNMRSTESAHRIVFELLGGFLVCPIVAGWGIKGHIQK